MSVIDTFVGFFTDLELELHVDSIFLSGTNVFPITKSSNLYASVGLVVLILEFNIFDSSSS